MDEKLNNKLQYCIEKLGRNDLAANNLINRLDNIEEISLGNIEEISIGELYSTLAYLREATTKLKELRGCNELEIEIEIIQKIIFELDNKIHKIGATYLNSLETLHNIVLKEIESIRERNYEAFMEIVNLSRRQ